MMTPTDSAAMSDADSIIFDCDGVLVDIVDSYNETISQTVSCVLDRLGYKKTPPVTGGIIQAFKDTGGFNNEVDLAYGVIVSMAAARDAGLDIRSVVMRASESPDVSSVQKFAMSVSDVSHTLDRLAYPGRDSMVQEIFDQIFYGPELYRSVFGQDSQFDKPGLIENEKVLLDDALSESLQKRFGQKMALVTGRGYDSARHTLGDRIDLFSLEASAFLEDKPRWLAKPNPESLDSAIRIMDADICIYVGDSAEDMMMARRAHLPVIFVGVYGTAPDPVSRRRLFESYGVRYTVPDIAHLPSLLR